MVVYRRMTNKKRGFKIKKNRGLIKSSESKIVFSIVFLFAVLIVASVIEIIHTENRSDQFFKVNEDISFSPEQNENYIVVALYTTTNELQVLQQNDSRSYNVVAQADLSTRIEALTIGDVDNDGREEIVVGLDRASSPQLQVFRFSTRGTLEREIVSEIIPSFHIEGLDVGDVDNDGQNEIVVGLEQNSLYSYGPSVSRVRMYKFNSGVWRETNISAPDTIAVQDVKIADPDDDGQNEIVGLFANPYSSSPPKVQIHRKVQSDWISENVTIFLGSPSMGAERLVVADADGDGDNEIITAYWDHYGGENFKSKVFSLDFQGATWVKTALSTDITGSVDGIAVFDFRQDMRPNVIVGTVRYTSARINDISYDPVTNNWTTVLISPVVGDVFDVDFGDVDNDGQNEIIFANGLNLRRLEPGDVEHADIIKSFPVYVDSAIVARFPKDTCGDSILEEGEQCDDGNTINGDGCSATCRGECFDSDYGNYYKKGITGPDLNGVNYTDYCYSNQYNLMEYSCVDGLVTNSSFYCARGCLNGACKSPLGSSPTPVAPSATNPSPGSGAIQ